jgi:hypothetical protein
MLGIAAQIIALGLLLTLTCLALGSGSATSLGGRIGSWKTEPGVSPPSYAVTEPIESNLNVDTVVLLCSDAARGRVLELDLYLSKPHFLVPNGADQRSLKDDPSVEIIVDGRTFNADLLFADGYVVVADATDHRQPFLSQSLLDDLQHGRTMVLRFDLLREGVAQSRHSQLVIDLRSGHAAIAAVRRCARKYQGTPLNRPRLMQVNGRVRQRF